MRLRGPAAREGRRRRGAPKSSKREMRRRAYAADMNLAHQAVRMNNWVAPGNCSTDISPRPDKKSFAGWRYL
jgi:hypothetical protein